MSETRCPTCRSRARDMTSPGDIECGNAWHEDLDCGPQEACSTCGSDDPKRTDKRDLLFGDPLPCSDPFHSPPQENRSYHDRRIQRRRTESPEYRAEYDALTSPQEADDRKQVSLDHGAVPSWTISKWPDGQMFIQGPHTVPDEAGPLAGESWLKATRVEVVPASELARVEALYEQIRAYEAANEAVAQYRIRATTAEAERDAALAKLKELEAVRDWAREKARMARAERDVHGDQTRIDYCDGEQKAWDVTAARLDTALSNQEEA